ncbi:MAG: lipid-A-disaccharide synthase, partial [Muribaculum sp.]|nr:lipid-A-disaccharide synthase [Muribaculum sp.]
MKYFVSAGEASGDLHASQLMSALKGVDRDASFTFLGGDYMAASAGHGPVIHYRDMAFMGFSEVLRNLGRISLNFKMARGALLGQKHDALILVDYPSFNLKLAREARRAGIPVYYYISPKVWAWKEYRVRDIKRLVRRVYSILPFEVDWYRSRHDYAVEYVGNPSREEVDARLSQLPRRNEFLTEAGIDPDGDYVVLVPGSRKGEIRNNLPVMIAGAMRSGLPMVVTAAPGIDDSFYEPYIKYGVKPVRDMTLGLMRYARVALVTSGTATLECGLAGTPQVVCYRANGVKLSYKIMEKLLKVKYVSLPNLIADEEIVPELLVHKCTAESIYDHLSALLPDGGVRQSQLDGYRKMRNRLGDRPAAVTTA